MHSWIALHQESWWMDGDRTHLLCAGGADMMDPLCSGSVLRGQERSAAPQLRWMLLIWDNTFATRPVVGRHIKSQVLLDWTFFFCLHYSAFCLSGRGHRASYWPFLAEPERQCRRYRPDGYAYIADMLRWSLKHTVHITDTDRQSFVTSFFAYNCKCTSM